MLCIWNLTELKEIINLKQQFNSNLLQLTISLL